MSTIESTDKQFNANVDIPFKKKFKVNLYKSI